MKQTRVRPVEKLRYIYRSLFRAARRRHDRFLVYNMVSFNFSGGWQELLLKAEVAERFAA
jgi:hypothetical protein